MSFATKKKKKITLEIVQRERKKKELVPFRLKSRVLLVKSKSYFPGCWKAASHTVCYRPWQGPHLGGPWDTNGLDSLPAHQPCLPITPSVFLYLHFCPKPRTPFVKIPQAQPSVLSWTSSPDEKAICGILQLPLLNQECPTKRSNQTARFPGPESSLTFLAAGSNPCILLSSSERHALAASHRGHREYHREYHQQVKKGSS